MIACLAEGQEAQRGNHHMPRISGEWADDYGGFGNEILYDMCRREPRHDDLDVVCDKLWLIGRNHAASAERNRVKDYHLERTAWLIEQPRNSWRLQRLRGWSHEHASEVFPGSTRSGGADGAGAAGHAQLPGGVKGAGAAFEAYPRGDAKSAPFRPPATFPRPAGEGIDGRPPAPPPALAGEGIDGRLRPPSPGLRAALDPASGGRDFDGVRSNGPPSPGLRAALDPAAGKGLVEGWLRFAARGEG